MHVRPLETVRFVARTYATLRAVKARRVSPSVAGERVARDVEAMGPLYVKMAQFVSARKDAADPEFIDALAAVQDNVPSDVRADPPCVPGYTFHDVPIARASIADVFEGFGPEGRVVAKRRRAGVKEKIHRDLPLLLGVMRIAAFANVPGAQNMSDLLRETTPLLLSELDFVHEAGSQQEFATLVEDVPWIKVPKVLQASDDLLVQEFVPGHRLAHVVTPNKNLAARLMDLYMLMVDRGLVHADPHPGNLGVREGGVLVLYDFGAVVHVDPSMKAHVSGLLFAGATLDTEGVLRSLESMGVIDVAAGKRAAVRGLVRRALAGDVHAELARSPEFNDSDRRVVRLSQSFAYLVRSFCLVESMCRALDTEFVYDYQQWLQPREWTQDASRFARDVASLPPAVHTMQLGMEEFQGMVFDEIQGMKHAARTTMAFAVTAAAYFFLT